MRAINAIIKLRRDNEYNFDSVKDTFIPANGEVVLVDTRSSGLRAKVGDGVSTFANLTYIDADYRDAVISGYYYEGSFYESSTRQVMITGQTNKLYIDRSQSKIYYYDGEHYVPIDNTIDIGSSDRAGIVKMYNTTGQQTDGTMTQKAITDELNVRYKASVNSGEELLIFSL